MTALWITLAILGYLFMAWVTATVWAEMTEEDGIDGMSLFMGLLWPAMLPVGGFVYVLMRIPEVPPIPRLWRRRD